MQPEWTYIGKRTMADTTFLEYHKDIGNGKLVLIVSDAKQPNLAYSSVCFVPNI